LTFARAARQRKRMRQNKPLLGRQTLGPGLARKPCDGSSRGFVRRGGWRAVCREFRRDLIQHPSRRRECRCAHPATCDTSHQRRLRQHGLDVLQCCERIDIAAGTRQRARTHVRRREWRTRFACQPVGNRALAAKVTEGVMVGRQFAPVQQLGIVGHPREIAFRLERRQQISREARRTELPVASSQCPLDVRRVRF